MVAILSALVGGYLAAARFHPSPVLLSACVLAALFASLFLRRRRAVRSAFLLAAVAALAALRAGSPVQFPDWLLLRTPRITELTGSVVSYASLGNDRIRFAVQPDVLPGRVLVTWECPGAPAGTVHFGDRVRVAGRAERPGVFDGFDYGDYLRHQGVFATMFVEEAGLSVEGSRPSVVRAGDVVRQNLLRSLQTRLRPADFALAQSYVFGDRYALSDETEEAFARTGLVHILAVSGMHLTVLLAGAWWVLRALRVRPAVAYPLLAVAVLATVWIIGPWISFARSALLFAFVAAGSVLADLGLILRDSIRPMNALAAAATALLLIQPESLFDVGFQLSIAATAGLLTFAPRFRRPAGRRGFVRRLRRAAGNLFLVSLAAQAGAAPILAWQFERLQVWTAVAGLVAIPIASLALWLGVLALALAALGPVADVAAALFGWSLRAFEAVVVAADRLPWTTLPADGRIGLWMAGLALFLALARPIVLRPSQLRGAGTLRFHHAHDGVAAGDHGQSPVDRRKTSF